MATGRRVEEQTLIYRGIKKITAENDTTYRCLIFSLVEYNKKGKEKEVITFYVTDDRNHLPVRLDMHLNFGSAKAFLEECQWLPTSSDFYCHKVNGTSSFLRNTLDSKVAISLPS